MSEHTPGPLEVYDETNIFAPSSPRNADIAADAKRIVACVNACEGINPEAVPRLLKAAKGMVAAASATNFYEAAGVALEALEAAITKAKSHD